MDSITLEEVKKAKSFVELEYKYIPNLIFTLGEKDRRGENIMFKYTKVCARSIYYQIYHYNKRNEYGNNFYNVDSSVEYCKGRQYCGNTHIDVKKFNKLSYCGVHLVKGKCRFGVDCRYLHIFDDTRYSTSPPISPPILPPISPPILNSILDYKPQPIQVPTFSECQECVDYVSTSETLCLNTNSSTSETQGLNTNSSTSESHHQSSYSLVDYWKEWAKITTEKIRVESQLIINNNYSEYQIEIMKLQSKLKNEVDKAARDREYYKERLNYFQKQINRNFRDDKYDDRNYEREYDRKRQRYY